MIIWNFMEELWRKYQRAITDGQQPTFSLKDFKYLGVFQKYLPTIGVEPENVDNLILETLDEYEQKGYYEIEDNKVNLTEKGILECQKSVHDWC